jgi:hypothetical protein
MKAAVFRHVCAIDIEDRPIPKPAFGEISHRFTLADLPHVVAQYPSLGVVKGVIYM